MLSNKIKYLREIWHRDIMSMRSVMRSFFSYIQNEMLLKQNIEWDEFEDYNYFRNIHYFLKLYNVENMEANICRVGGATGDGGYIMVKPYSENHIAYSLGIGGNVSWDKQMAEQGYQIYQYDHTIKKLPRTHPNFHWKKVGITGDKASKQLRTLKSLIKENGHDEENGMVLKMDIEGCEWEVLKTIDHDTLNKFDQILVEFHGISDIKMRKCILSDLKKLSNLFAVIHIHGCNYSWVNYCNNLITPDTIEVTLVNRNKYSVSQSERLLPCSLDRPDDPKIPEIWLGVWNSFEK